MTGGEGTSGDGGAVAVSAGSAPALTGAGSGGGVSISAGAAHVGGSIELGSGEGRSEGGTISLSSGEGGAADRSGSVSLSTGDGPSSGDVRLGSGEAHGADRSGSVVLQAASAALGSPGSVDIKTGEDGSIFVSSGEGSLGGSVMMSASAGAQFGGNIEFAVWCVLHFKI